MLQILRVDGDSLADSLHSGRKALENLVSLSVDRQTSIGMLEVEREYETARIGEVNDTPVITVIYPAASPQKKSKPKRTLLVLLALVFGGVVGAFGVEYVDRARSADEDQYREFRRLLTRVRHDLPGIFRPKGG